MKEKSSVTQPEKPKIFTFDSETSITPLETNIMHTIGAKERRFLKEKYVNGLEKIKTEIVAVRAEDIFYFLQSIRQGYFSTAKFILTEKAGIGDVDTNFYTNLNPDSSYLQKASPDIKWGTFDSFEKIAENTIGLYGHIGVKQAIFRNIFPLIRDQSSLAKQIQQAGWTDYSDNIAWESFFDVLVKTWSNNHRMDQKKAIEILLQHIDNAVLNEKTLLEYIDLLNIERRGLLIGFNEQIMQQQLYAGQGDGGEDIFIFPDKKVSVDLIAGYETFGEFEYIILEELGII